MEAKTTKYITMVLLAGVSLILGFLPLKISKYFLNDEKIWKKTLTSVLLCFGGGVLFATSFTHMLPEVRENIEESGIDFGDASGCLAEILLCAGFFLIYFIEESVHFFLDSGVHHHHDETIQAHRSFSIHSTACEAGLIDIQKCASPRVGESPRNTRRQRTISYPATLTNYKTFNSNGLESNNIAGTAALTLSKISEIPTPSAEDSCENDTNPFTKSSLRDFFTVLALSFHAVFEGLAVGLESEPKDVWLLFAAVATHKYVISFCVGLELCNAKTRLLIYSVYMIVFAIMSPIGIGIGIIITSNAATTSAYFLSVAILQALAGGTIIYVVVFEVLERERSKNVSGLAQLFFVILGFCVLMSVELLAGHDHNHNHEDEHDTRNLTTLLLSNI